MKKTIILVLIAMVLLPTLALGELTKVEIPLRTTWENNNESWETQIEIEDQDTDNILKRWEINENNTGEEEWTLKYYIDSDDFCPDYINSNSSENFYNMTVMLDRMLVAFNKTANMSESVILSQDINRMLGECNGTAEERLNHSITLKEENTQLIADVSKYKNFQTLYNGCKDDKEAMKKNVMSNYLIGGLVCVLGYHFLIGKKKSKPDEADNEEWEA